MDSVYTSLLKNGHVESFSGLTNPTSGTRVSELRLILVNSVVAGLEIAASVGFTFVPPLLLKSGYSEPQMTIIFGIAPFIALFTVPMIGKWSDECTSRWGRRRPYIFILSIFLIVSLVLLVLGQILVSQPMSKYAGMCIVAFAVILLDYASQAAINPCESLVADLLHSTTNANHGFMIYSAMLSFGSCIGYMLAAVDWSIVTGHSEQTALLLVLLMFTITLVVTMMSAKEKPLKSSLPAPIIRLEQSEKASSDDDDAFRDTKSSSRMQLKKWIRLRNGPQLLPGVSFILVFILKLVSMLLEPLKKIYDAPLVIRRLFVADLLSWVALMSHNMFCTDFVATVVYGGKAEAERGSLEDLRFDEGVRMGSLGLMIHSTTACLFASFLQDTLTNLVGSKVIYMFGLISFGISMLFTVLFPTVIVLNVCAAISGFGFAVATTVPGTLITQYHASPEVYFRGRTVSVGFGSDMALLDITYYLSQIILSLFMGQIVKSTGLPHFYIIVASFSAFLSAAFATKVSFSQSDCAL